MQRYKEILKVPNIIQRNVYYLVLFNISSLIIRVIRVQTQLYTADGCLQLLDMPSSHLVENGRCQGMCKPICHLLSSDNGKCNMIYLSLLDDFDFTHCRESLMVLVIHAPPTMLGVENQPSVSLYVRLTATQPQSDGRVFV
jgi:hypothetical protein